MNYPKIIPKDLAPILWSYDVAKLDPWHDRRSIIVNTINYGDLKQWRWLVKNYGATEVQQVLKATNSSTALRSRARKLFSLLLSNEPYYTP